MPFILGLIRIIPAIVSAFALFFIGAGAMAYWDRRPPKTPNIKVLFFRWSPPDSLAAQRDAAVAELKRCQANEAGLLAAVKAQNAATEALAREGRDRLAKAEKAVSEARRGGDRARKRASELLSAPPVGIDACQRMLSADEAVLSSLSR